MENNKPEINFSLFISGLMAEGLVALGLIENPVTKKAHKDLRHASVVIDTLNMLKEKTKGNLTKEESNGLEETIHQLRMMYLAEMDVNPKDDSSKEVPDKDKERERHER